ncbi:hypothetical protein COU15_01135 [Candidatus Kaiserbacteria bacterium CG10_big_fil_rev_8_21_14_0_10_45_20]|uniref:ZIP family metal transporter n=1 Tax=Candidatus Kaiserbacteria bacterium CG10_big_fil_rev_8_21_14_0_10_45_20 TaxID=1974607 RepID=A0A2H0UFZ6_9BACT|nr:MAG: hypothetical protein COU15_01135 [Candidatus Kaiserbacteria bacterium CG10_big_fil_rev_8_21_14_0_10_45_20]
MLLYILLASFAIMLVSLIGIVTVWKYTRAYLERNLNFFVSFAAGVFIVLVFTLIEEVLTHAHTLLYGLGWIVGGFVVAFFITKLYPESHHHGDTHQIKNVSSSRLILGDSFHNIGDGILLAVAFTTSPFLGVVTTLSVLFHELVQEISEFFVLRKSGHSTITALQINFLTASTILIGSVGGYFFLEKFSALEIPALGLAAGALFALLTQDLIPHSLKYAVQKGCGYKHVLAVLAGAVIMFFILTVTSLWHSHEHAIGHDDDHTLEAHSEELHDDHEDHHEPH